MAEFPFAVSFVLDGETKWLFRSTLDGATDCALEQARASDRSAITVWQATHTIVPTLAEIPASKENASG